MLALENPILYNKVTRRRSQVARQESAKLPFSGSNPLVASILFIINYPHINYTSIILLSV